MSTSASGETREATPEARRPDGHRGAARTIAATVGSWPGASTGIGSRGEYELRLGARQLGHLHGDRALHIGFPKAIGAELREQGRVRDHPVFPGNDGWAAKAIATAADVDDAIALLRMNYDRAVARHGLPSAAPAGLEEVHPGLFASAPASIFDESTDVRSFLLDRGELGNALVSASPTTIEDARAIRGFGGVELRLLVHWHEAMFGTGIGEALGGELVVGEADRAETEAHGSAVSRTVSERTTAGPDLELIPAPGHTPGTTLVLWDSGDGRVLFSGDTLWIDADGDWAVAVLDSSDREAYLRSLELIRELEFDLLVPWAVGRGAAAIAATDRADRQRRLDRIIARVRSGATR